MDNKKKFMQRASVLFLSMVVSVYGLPAAAAVDTNADVVMREGVITQALAEAGEASGEAVTYSSATTLTEDTVINGDLTVKANLDLAGYKLTVKGSLIQSSGVLKVNGGSLLVDGDYRIQDVSNSVYTYAYAKLNMTNANDYVLVKGDFYTQSTYSHSELLTAGVLELKGSFTQINSGANAANFKATGTHQVKFTRTDGTKQIVKFNTPASSNFADAVFDYSKIQWDSDFYGWELKRNLTLPGGVNIKTLNVGGKTVTIKGGATQSGDIHIGTGALNISGSLLQTSGMMYTEQGKLTVNGDYRIQNLNGESYTYAYGKLSMTDPAAYVLVKGDFYTQSTYAHDSFLTAGVLELKGDFTQITSGANSANFKATSAHQVKFTRTDGTKQVVKFDTPASSNFADAVFDYSKVQWDSDFYGWELKSDLTLSGGVNIKSLDVGSHTVTIKGDVTQSGNINIGTGALNVEGSLLQTSGIMYTEQGKLTVNGDYRIQNLNGESYTYAYGKLSMTDPAAYVLVKGDFYTQSTYAHDSFLTAGVLELKGDFTQITSGANSANFKATSAHQVKFTRTDGTKQVVKFDTPASSNFADAVFDYSKIQWDSDFYGWEFKRDTILPGGMVVKSLGIGDKTVTFKGDVTQSGDIYVNVGALNIEGNLMQTTGVMDLCSGKLTVNGDYRIQNLNKDVYTYSYGKLSMTTPEAYVLVKGNFYTQSSNSHNGLLTNGVFELKGDFTQLSSGASTANFKATQNHTAILSKDSGTSQKVSFQNYSSSSFNNLILTRDVKNYVFEPETCWTGDMEVIYPLVNKSKVSSKAVYVNQKVTVTGLASGGKGAYTYKFYYSRGATGNWTEFKDANIYNNGTSASLKPGSAKTYGIKIVVTDERGTSAEKIYNISVTNPLVNESTINKTECYKGDCVTITGKASGGATPYKYQFYYKKASVDNWSSFKDTSLSNNGTVAKLYPGTATTYNVKVVVTDKDGKTEEKIFDINVKNKIQNTSTVSATSVTLGKTIKVTGACTGGIGDCTYEFYYKRTNASSWTKYGGETTASLKPTKAGVFDLLVYARDSKGMSSAKTFRVTFKEAAALENTSTISAENVKAGQKVTITPSAAGGSGDYTYEYYYKRTSSTKWIKLNKDYIVPSTAGTIDLIVYVNDASGNTSMKTFTLNIT